MIQYQLKLRLTKVQEDTCIQWLYHLTSIYNWALRKIELNAKDKIYFSKFTFVSLLSGGGLKLNIPSHVIQGILKVVWQSWDRCFKKKGGKPKLKGMRNKLTYIPFPDPIKSPINNRIKLPYLGSVKFHKMEIPEGKIKCGRIIKKASGWYLCLFIDAEPKIIERTTSGKIGIDPGFSHLITTSDGEIIEHPREFEKSAKRLGQSQRGKNKKLMARIHEKIANQKKDRNHKLSRKLVSENIFIAFSKDRISNIAKRFGKSVSSSAHYQLRQMIQYKSPKSGTEYIEVESKFSTKTCNECGCLSGPTGLTGLSVRVWECSNCGVIHDRDINAAINTLKLGLGYSLES